MTNITPERLAQIEADAPAIIHNAMRFDRMEFTPPWINGNSDAEDEARQTVRILRIPDLIAALEAAQAENAKLREALKIIREAWPKTTLGPVKMPPFREQVRMFADINALLESKP